MPSERKTRHASETVNFPAMGERRARVAAPSRDVRLQCVQVTDARAGDALTRNEAANSHARACTARRTCASAARSRPAPPLAPETRIAWSSLLSRGIWRNTASAGELGLVLFLSYEHPDSFQRQFGL
jgi:hypothetical protein